MRLNRIPVGRAVLALVAAFAMLVQAFSGPAAMAAPASVQTIEICTSHGLETIKIAGSPDKQTPAPCPHCDHCLAPALATTADLPLAIQPAFYATGEAFKGPAPAQSPHAARAPPKPPSQGPPLS